MAYVYPEQLGHKLSPGSAFLRDQPKMALALAEYCSGVAKLVSTTSAFRKAMGLSRTTADGCRLEDAFAGEDAIQLKRLIDRTLKSAAAGVASSDQTLRGRRIVAHPVANAGDTQQVVLAVEPASPSHHLSPHNQQLFDRLGPISSGLLYVYDLGQRRTRYLHPDLMRLLGVSASGSRGDELSRRVHPEDLPIIERHFRDMAAMSDEAVVEATFRVKGSDEEWRLVRSRGRVFARGADGAVRRVIGVATDVTRAAAQAQALEQAECALANAEAEERQRIGRELHDSTAQHLVAVGLSLAALERRAVFGDSEQSILRDIRNSLAAAHREIRTFAFMLHPPQAEERPFEDRLRAFADGFGRRASLRITVEVSGVARRLTTSVEAALFRIFQEALMNVHRHSGARSVAVLLGYGRDNVSLEVEDDGVGASAGVLLNRDEETGVGIASMRSRISQLGGRFEMENGRSGLRIRAEAPVRASRSWVVDEAAGRPVGARQDYSFRRTGTPARPLESKWPSGSWAQEMTHQPNLD